MAQGADGFSYEKEQHSVLEYERHGSSAGTPLDARRALGVYEVGKNVHDFVSNTHTSLNTRVSSAAVQRAKDLADTAEATGSLAPKNLKGKAFKKRISKAVHRRAENLAPVASESFASEVASEVTHTGKETLKHSIKQLPRNMLYKLDALAKDGADAPEKDEAAQAVSKVSAHADPVTLKGEISFAKNEIAPAGRARKRLARWDAKANVAQGKARFFELKGENLRLKGAKIANPDSLRARINFFRKKRTTLRAAKLRGRALRLQGVGGGVRAHIMSLRRKKAGVQKGSLLLKVFGSLGTTGLCAMGFLIAMIVIFTLMAGAAGGSGQNDDNGLSGNEATIAYYLQDKGLDNYAVAAVMGNMDAESGFNPAACNASSGAFGLCQWLGGRLHALESLASSKGKPVTDIPIQLDYLLSELAGSGWAHGASDYDYFLGLCKNSDLNGAVYAFVDRFERPSEAEKNNSLARRCATARRILDALTKGGGSGQDYESASEQQKKIVDACKSTPSPGAGLCAAWVSQVYQNAGLGRINGNADDMYAQWCHSSNRSELKVGMLIAIDQYITSGYPYAGYSPNGDKLSYHVGIYIGDGKVMDNIGSVETTSLDNWLSTYGNYHEVRWGFGPNIS